MKYKLINTGKLENWTPQDKQYYHHCNALTINKLINKSKSRNVKKHAIKIGQINSRQC